MFEQTFIREDRQDNKRYTVLVSLLLQITTLGVLILVPLIYTQVLPQARLRSVFAAPTPPPPALPKSPAVKLSTQPVTAVFRLPVNTVFAAPRPLQNVTAIAQTDTPDLVPGIPTGETSLPFGTPDGAQIKPPEPQKTPVSRQPANKQVRIASLDPSQLIHKVQPAYPAIAQQVHVQGQVIFSAVISKSGTIENLQLVSGHPLLVLAARDAILQWRYKPTFLGGEPVEVVTNIVVNFTLNEH